MKRLSLVLMLMCVLVLPSALRAQAPTEMTLTIQDHRFQPQEIVVKAGAPFVLVIVNKDATPEEFESKQLRIEKVVAGSKTVRLRMPALKAGTYPFVGEYNEKTAQGRIIAE